MPNEGRAQMSSSSTLESTLAQPWVELFIRLSTRLTEILALLLKTISATWSNSLGCGWVYQETVTNILTNIIVRRIPPSFTSLPPEVIVEILKELKCQDILRVQQTCRRLRDISSLRSLWLFLITEYSTASPSRTCPEEPLKCYSTRELQRWLFTRVSADIGWKSIHPIMPTRQRTLEYKYTWTAKIIPGGRWLLTGSSEGYVTAHDLDSLDIRSTLLIEPIDEQGSHPVTLMALYIDSSAPTLTFDLVLSPYSRRVSQPNSSIHFWQVVLNGHGASATLKAKHLKTLTTPQSGIKAISLHDHLYTQLVYTTPPRCEAYDWRKSTSESCTLTSFTTEGNSSDIHLLPDNMVACFSRTTLLIYEIPLLRTHQSVRNDSALQSPILQPLWRLENLSIRIRHGGLSQPYVFRDVTRFTFTDSSGSSVYGLVIPRDKSRVPYSFKFMDNPWMVTFSCGYEKLFAKQNEMAGLFCIQWPDGCQNKPSESPFGSVVTKEFTEMGETALIPLLDEELARVVISVGQGFTVIDFALCLDNISHHNST